MLLISLYINRTMRPSGDQDRIHPMSAGNGQTTTTCPNCRADLDRYTDVDLLYCGRCGWTELQDGEDEDEAAAGLP
jgi:ribosomal protein S27AE